MAVFGRRSARQRMRRATEQALSVPTFRSPEDCTPWVLGGLWPAELDQATTETATLAAYLKRDLHRIADSANHKLRVLNEADLAEPIRRAEQHRVINVARTFAVLRVESTVRQLRKEALSPTTEFLRLDSAAEDQTGVIPRLDPHLVEAGDDEPDPVVAVISSAPEESVEQRLHRLIDGLARQEPGVRWGAGLRTDGSTLVVTDVANGWIPPGIDLPAGVEVLPPARRTGNLRALLGSADPVVTYRPGDAFGSGSSGSEPGRGVRVAPEVTDLGRQLAEATRRRDGLPRITHTLAKAASSGTGVVEAELDVLRVHLDTARYQLLARYPGLDPGLLLNCLLLSATQALATGDREAANYHFAWFQALT
ncbi:DUF5631 domain-containing protein [Mycolicibacterium mengxianglii]|uniref:DUF5631 domain-containing protein n=1 Tax=Mycolicibacterium mengxianglii TaxID=2736649 RepID=UPI0018D020D4|nr:DUF5631 domain-containing protein [Mycolicibacterium mengxianglii]